MRPAVLLVALLAGAAAASPLPANVDGAPAAAIGREAEQGSTTHHITRRLTAVFGEPVSDPAAAPAAARRLAQAATLPPTSQVLTTPSNCSGWPEKRVYMESQAWFTRPGGNVSTDSAHLHVGACFPQRARIRGDLTLHLLVQKHQFFDNTTQAAGVDIQISFSSKFNTSTVVTYTVSSSALQTATWACKPYYLCKAVLPVTVVTWSGSPSMASVPDGLNTVTIRAAHNGLNDGLAKRLFEARLTGYFQVDNQLTGVGAIGPNQVLPVGQLGNTNFPWGYTHAHLVSNMPTSYVNDTWAPSIRNFLDGAASRTVNVTGVFVSIDPNFHNPTLPNFLGTRLLEGTVEQLRGNCPLAQGPVSPLTPACSFDLSIDTTLLTRGTHKLFMRTDSFVDPKHPVLAGSNVNGGTFSGVLVIVFDVCNDDDPATCAEPMAPPPDETPAAALPPIAPPPGATWYKPADPIPNASGLLATPYDCSGWRGSRWYFESQSWFTPEGKDVEGASTQLQVGACLPHKQMVAGTIPIHVLVSKLNFAQDANVTVTMQASFAWKGGNVSFSLKQNGAATGWVCANRGTQLCRVVWSFRINTRPDPPVYYMPDGLHAMSLWANVQIWDGVVKRTLWSRLDSYLVLANNAPTDLTGKSLPPLTFGNTFAPWHDSYVQLLDDLPLATYTGPMKFNVKFLLTGNTGANTTGAFAALDPVLMPGAVDRGYAVVTVPPSNNGWRVRPNPTNCVMDNKQDSGPLYCSFSIDPKVVPLRCPLNPCTTGLCDGLHRLVLRTDSFVNASHPIMTSRPSPVGSGTFSTVMILPIVTRNGISAGASASCAAVKTVSSAKAAAALASGADVDAATLAAFAAASSSADGGALALAAQDGADAGAGPSSAQAQAPPADVVAARAALPYAAAGISPRNALARAPRAASLSAGAVDAADAGKHFEALAVKRRGKGKATDVRVVEATPEIIKSLVLPDGPGTAPFSGPAAAAMGAALAD